MARHILLLFLALGLVVSPEVLRAQASPVDPDVAKGIKLVDEGDYDGAILTLDNAARRLAATPGQVAELSRAYLYLGIAYVGKGHEAAAKAKFREAIAGMKDLSLSPDKFPPKVIDLFEAARQEATKVPPPSQPQVKKGGSKKGLLIGGIVAGGVVVVGGGVALAVAASGSENNEPTDSRTVENFTGTLCGWYHEPCEDGRCYDIVVSAPGRLDATVTWTDPSMCFDMRLFDGNDTEAAASNRITNTVSQMTASVTPQTACSTCSYRVCVSRQDALGEGTFILTVTHP